MRFAGCCADVVVEVDRLLQLSFGGVEVAGEQRGFTGEGGREGDCTQRSCSLGGVPEVPGAAR